MGVGAEDMEMSLLLIAPLLLQVLGAVKKGAPAIQDNIMSLCGLNAKAGRAATVDTRLREIEPVPVFKNRFPVDRATEQLT